MFIKVSLIKTYTFGDYIDAKNFNGREGLVEPIVLRNVFKDLDHEKWINLLLTMLGVEEIEYDNKVIDDNDDVSLNQFQSR